jgi:hypothetical protein
MPLNQVEVLVQNDKATKEIETLTASLRAAGVDVPAQPRLTDDMIQDGELLAAHVAKLRVLSKCTPTSAPAPTATAPGTPPPNETLTAKCIRLNLERQSLVPRNDAAGAEESKKSLEKSRAARAAAKDDSNPATWKKIKGQRL